MPMLDWPVDPSRVEPIGWIATLAAALLVVVIVIAALIIDLREEAEYRRRETPRIRPSAHPKAA